MSLNIEKEEKKKKKDGRMNENNRQSMPILRKKLYLCSPNCKRNNSKTKKKAVL